MITTRTVLLVILVAATTAVAGLLVPSNILPDHKFSWSENHGWMNWRDADATNQGVLVDSDFLTGFVWFENGGWMNTGDGFGPYANTGGSDFGVNILANGDLEGFAWSENLGWANFGWAAGSGNPDRARFDSTTDRFRGWAWLENGGWVNLDDATHYVGVEESCLASSVAAANPATPTDGTHGSTPRFLSFYPGDPGQSQAIRVTFPDPMPSPYGAWSGLQMWVGPPTRYCENSGSTVTPNNTPPTYGCDPAPGLPQRWFMASELQCAAYYTDWHGVCDGGLCLGGLRDGLSCSSVPECSEPVYVLHEGIIPSTGPHNASPITPTTYAIQVIDEICDTGAEGDYSTSLMLTTSKWGDTVENTASSPYPAPEGIIQITDVLAILAKFQNLDTSSISARVDLMGATEPKYLPDHLIDIGDVLQALFAFQAVKYPSPAITGVPTPRPCAP